MAVFLAKALGLHWGADSRREMALGGGHTRKQLRLTAVAAIATLLGGAVHGILGDCGPFTDVGAGPPNFCPFILELYYLGITAGTSPDDLRAGPAGHPAGRWLCSLRSLSINRSGEAAGGLSASGGPRRTRTCWARPASRRARRAWHPMAPIWVAHHFPSHVVTRIRAGDGRLLEHGRRRREPSPWSSPWAGWSWPATRIRVRSTSSTCRSRRSGFDRRRFARRFPARPGFRRGPLLDGEPGFRIDRHTCNRNAVVRHDGFGIQLHPGHPLRRRQHLGLRSQAS